MAFATSSILGADFNNSSTTQMFALNTKALGNNDSEFQYVIATAALATGQICYIQFQGTADVMTTGAWAGAGLPVGVSGNMDVGIAQTSIAAGSYGWVLKRGQNAYVLCSGTCPSGVPVGFTNSGTLVTAGNVAVSLTAMGIFITTSASTATPSVANALVVYPRPVGQNTTGLFL